ncbi:MAG: arabinogalactan endo-1,4-beta-galactosidase, partial [Bacteroidaceae bacterium]|nr:arabinogalactan endo-1,4-beta-galactosidase [Bacteroidaceae bacterium]
MVKAQNTISLGGDISMLPAYENVNTPYYDLSGKQITPLSFLKDEVKMNSMRVRLFVNPTERTSGSKTGVVQDIEYVKELGKMIKDAGLDFMLDFHYSDCWADPSYQDIPSSWYTGTLSASNPSDDALVDSMYSYTKRNLEYLVANGVTPDYIQIGNEISYGMLWRTTSDKCYTNYSSTHKTWKRLASLLNSAAKAVREVTPKAKIILHIERSGQSDVAKSFFERMNANNVDYDIIGLSYYPFYHGYLSALSTTLNTLEKSFPDKPVHIVETAYFYQNFG